MLKWDRRYFPEGTEVSPPQGAFVLWVQLPARVDCVRLNEQMDNVTIAPGSLFSASRKYRHCMRLNFASQLTDKVEAAVKTVGEAATMMVARDQVERAAAR